MAETKGHGDHGSDFGTKVLKFGVGAILIVVAVVMLENWFKGRDLGYGFQSSTSNQFQGITTPQRTAGYIQGAPQTAQECVARGGSVVNNGRSCSGYR